MIKSSDIIDHLKLSGYDFYTRDKYNYDSKILGLAKIEDGQRFKIETEMSNSNIPSLCTNNSELCYIIKKMVFDLDEKIFYETKNLTRRVLIEKFK